MLLSPINSRDPSAQSVWNTRTVPFGRAIPNLLDFVLLNWILFDALRLCSEYPPALSVIKLYFLTLMSQTLGMNSTCLIEDSFKVTGWERVQRWQSEKDFQENEGAGAAALAKDIVSITIGLPKLGVVTVLTSPAISLSLAFTYFFPLWLSIVTHPPMSALVSAAFKVIEQSAFHENPVVLQATSQSVTNALRALTFQFSVGRVKNPSGKEVKETPSILLSTWIPFEVCTMYPLEYPKRIPVTL